MSFLEKISSDFPVGNAAGWCKSLTEVERLANSAAQFILVGSIKLEPSEGNPGNTFNNKDLNSLGLPQPGTRKISADAPEMVRLAHKAGKPIIKSLAGSTPEEYHQLACDAKEAGFDGVEINLGCPNEVVGSIRKPIASFDRSLSEAIISPIIEAHRGLFISAKVSVESNPLNIIDMAELLARLGVSAVVTMNTFANALSFNEDGRPQIDTPDCTGWAGYSGEGVGPIARGQVSQYRAALNSFGAEHIEVWGVGGVTYGRDVRDMKWAGASKIQVGTAYFVGGPKVFGDIATEYFEL